MSRGSTLEVLKSSPEDAGRSNCGGSRFDESTSKKRRLLLVRMSQGSQIEACE